MVEPTTRGYANVTGRDGRAFGHFRQVTGMTQSEVWDHIDVAGELWQQRSSRTWALDMSIPPVSSAKGSLSLPCPTRTSHINTTWTSPIPDDNSYAYKLTWNARDGDGLSVPYGVPDGRTVPQHIRDAVTGDLRDDGVPYTGTATTAGGTPEWHAENAPITGPAQIWRIDRDGNSKPLRYL
jgi:hypothetical protein